MRETESLFRLYAADMHLAQQYIQNNFVGGAVALLEKHRGGTGPDGYLGWEWHYLWRQCHPELRQFEGINGAVLTVAFSPDGRTLAAAGESGTVHLWETATGNLLRKLASPQETRRVSDGELSKANNLLQNLTGPQGAVNQIAFHPQGIFVAAVGEDTTVWVWDAQTGESVAALAAHEQPLDSVVFSPDGQLLATGGESEPRVRVWDTHDWAPLAVFENGHGCSLAFDRQSEHLAIGGADGRIRIVSLTDQKLTQTLQNLVDYRGGGVAAVHAVAFSHDGALFAAAGPGRRVTVWNTADWSPAAALADSTADVLSIAFDPSGRRLAVAGRDSVIRIWDLEEHSSAPLVLMGHTSHIMSVAFSPDRWRLASGSADGTVRLWNSYKAAEFDSLPRHRHYTPSVSFSLDGKTIATAAYIQSISIWSGPDFSIPRTLHIPGQRIWDIAFSPDGKGLAAVDHLGRLSVFDTGTLEQRLRVHVSDHPVNAVAFSPDGKQVVVAGVDRVVRYINAADGREILAATGHTGNVSALAFDPKGRLVASADNEGTLRIWNASNGKAERVIAAHRGEALCLAFHAHRPLLASGGTDETIRLWDVSTGIQLRSFVGHAGTVRAVKFSPDGRRLFSGSADGIVKIWDVASGLELCSLSGHSHWVEDIDAHRDGWSVISSGRDHQIRIWNARPLRPADQIAREAAGLVRFLASRKRTPEKTLAAIRSDATISDAARREAEDHARNYMYHLASIDEGHRAADGAAWPTAVAAFRQAVELAPREVWHWHFLAMAHLGAKDLDGFAQTREKMLRRFGQNPTEVETYVLARTCLVVSLPAPMCDSLSPVLSNYRRRFHDDPWPVVLFEIRRGQPPLIADQELERLRLNDIGMYVLALEYCRDGRSADARRAIALGDRDRLQTKSDWERELYPNILRAEVLELLKSTGTTAAATPNSPAATPDRN